MIHGGLGSIIDVLQLCHIVAHLRNVVVKLPHKLNAKARKILFAFGLLDSECIDVVIHSVINDATGCGPDLPPVAFQINQLGLCDLFAVWHVLYIVFYNIAAVHRHGRVFFKVSRLRVVTLVARGIALC